MLVTITDINDINDQIRHQHQLFHLIYFLFRSSCDSIGGNKIFWKSSTSSGTSHDIPRFIANDSLWLGTHEQMCSVWPLDVPFWGGLFIYRAIWVYFDSYKGVENTEFVFSFVMEIMKLGGENHDGKIDLIDIFISLPTFQQIVQKFDSQ